MDRRTVALSSGCVIGPAVTAIAQLVESCARAGLRDRYQGKFRMPGRLTGLVLGALPTTT